MKLVIKKVINTNANRSNSSQHYLQRQGQDKLYIFGKGVFIMQNVGCHILSQKLWLLTKKISLNFGKSPGKLLENSWNLITGLVHEPCFKIFHKPPRNRWQGRRSSPVQGGRCSCKPTLHGAGEGEPTLVSHYGS